MGRSSKEVADEVADELDGVEPTEKEETEEDNSSEENFLPKTDDDADEDGDEDASSTPEEDGDSEEDDGEEEGLIDELDLDDFEEDLEPADKKTGVQKRIDRLTAEKKALEERLAAVEAKQSDTKETVYSDSQLKKALSKAMEEGDASLMWEIMDYRIKNAEQQAVNKYRKADDAVMTQKQRHAQEWMSVVEENQYLSDENEPELYRGSHKELNLSDQNSTVFKLANKLYADPNKAERYLKDGGQRLAVSDAIRMILRKRNTKTTSKETNKLKRQLAKEKKKSTVSSGKSMKTETSKPITAKSNLEDYLSERKQGKAQLAGSF